MAVIIQNCAGLFFERLPFDFGPCFATSGNIQKLVQMCALCFQATDPTSCMLISHKHIKRPWRCAFPHFAQHAQCLWNQSSPNVQRLQHRINMGEWSDVLRVAGIHVRSLKYVPAEWLILCGSAPVLNQNGSCSGQAESMAYSVVLHHLFATFPGYLFCDMH